MTLRIVTECLRQSVSGDPWHGPSIDVLLADITPAQAVSHPIAGAHSIIAIVRHLSAWMLEVSARLRGNPANAPAIGDWPAHGSNAEAEWSSATNELRAAHSELLGLVRGFDPSRLAEIVGTAREPALGAGVSFAAMLLGLAQHAAYHGGQIALLKRALTRPGPASA